MATEMREAPKKVCDDDVGPTCLADIEKGLTANGDCGTDAHTRPAWLDHDRCEAGRKVFQEHACSFLLNFHFSLVLGFCVKPFIQALIFTGQSSTPADALARYVRTYKFLASWHLGDIFDDSETEDGMSAFTSVASVRNFHKSVRTKMTKSLPGTDVYMNQYDMALVQTGFMGALVVCPTFSGMKLTQQQIDDYVYFWRCVAHQLGVDDKYNLCGRGNPTATSITWEVVNKVIIPSEDDPPEPDYDTLVNAYLDSIGGGGPFPIFTRDAMLAYSYDKLGFTWPKTLSCGDKVRVFIYRCLMGLMLHAPGFAYIANHTVLCATKVMLKNWSFAQCKGPGICPVVGAAKDSEALMGKECPGASRSIQKGSRWQRFSQRATILAGMFLLFCMTVFWFSVIVGGAVLAGYYAVQYAR